MSHEMELSRIAPPYVFPSPKISGGTTYNDICSHKYPARVRSIVFECADIPGLELGDSLPLHSRETGKTVSGQVTMLHRAGEGFVPIKHGQCMISMFLEKAYSFECADSDEKSKEANNGN